MTPHESAGGCSYVTLLAVPASSCLHVELEIYQRLHDAGLPPPVTRLLLHEVDDHLEKVDAGEISPEAIGDREQPELDRLWRPILTRTRQLLGEDPVELSRAEASAWRLSARRTSEVLGFIERLPNEIARRAAREIPAGVDSELAVL